MPPRRRWPHASAHGCGNRMAEDMKELREKCGTPGSAQRAARALMNALEEQGSLEMF